MFELWNQHGTKILGLVGILQTVIAGALTIEGLIDPADRKWFDFANLVLCAIVVRRGFSNSAQIDARQGGGS